MSDREKVINALEHCIYECFDDCPYITLEYCRSDLMRDALELLEEQEIVRCKDCKYYRYYGPDSYISSECTLKFTDGPIPTWFCAGGERR